MKSFLPPDCVKGGMCLLHLQKATMSYRAAAFAAPPSEEGAANNQVFTDMPFTGAKNQR